MLFVESERFVHLQNHFQTIVSLFAAFNSSAVVYLRDFNIYMILHISKDGEQLFRLSINQGKRQSSLIMIDSSTVAVTNCESNNIIIIDLKTYNMRDIKHYFGPSRKASLFYFQETKLLCVAEQSELQITYYSIQGELIHKYKEPRPALQANRRVINYNYWKANRESMIVCQQKYNMKADIKDKRFVCIGLNGCQKIYEFPHRHSERSLSIFNAWSSPCVKQFYYVGHSFDGINLYTNDNGQIRQNAKYCLGKDNKIISGFGFHLGEHSAFSKEDENSINEFRCLIVKNQKIFDKQPILNDKDIVFQSKNVFKSIKFASTSQQPETVIIPEYQQKDKGGVIKFTEIRWSTMKEIRLHLMLHVNEDFDQDLLFDASELLEEER